MAGLRAIARTFVRAALLGVLLGAAFAHTGAAQANRPYRPAFDVLDYSITLDLPDTGGAIHADAVLSIARTGATDTLVLDLLDLGVNRVNVDGRAVKFTRTPTALTVVLPRKAKGASYRVDVEYGGTVTDGLIVHVDSAGRWTYFGDNWPDRARHWIPSIDHPSDKATVTWRVRAPAGRTVVANGKFIGTRVVRDDSGSERIEWEWRESQPIPVYLMVIAAGALVPFDLGDTACGLAEVQHCVQQSVYTTPERRENLPGAFARTPEILQLFARLVGPFPYEKLSHLQSSTRFGGMENASAIFYPDAAFQRGTPSEGTIAHETAHQWFGDAVTERDWSHLWLSEGFATYFSALWTRAARGDSAFLVEMAGIRAAILTDSVAVAHRPVIDSSQTNFMELLNTNSYQKGGFFLHMLRRQVGENAFFDALRSYYARHRHSTAVTDDLMAEMERTSHQRLGWFFDQWLRRPGFPEVTAAWSYDATTHEISIGVSQSARYGNFQFPLTIAVVDSSGIVRRATVQVSNTAGSTQPIRLPLSAPPARVVLDPDVELLAPLTVIAHRPQ